MAGIFIGNRNNKLAIENAHEYTQLIAAKNSNEVKAIFESYVGFVSAASGLYSTNINSDNNLNLDQIKYYISEQLDSRSDIDAIWLLLNNSHNEASSKLFKITKSNKSTLIKVSNPSTLNSFINRTNGNSLTTVSEPYFENEKLVIDIYSPVTNDSKIIGQFGITVDLIFFDDFIKNSYIYQGGFITVMSNSSIFVAHSVKKLIGKSFSENFAADEQNFNVENKISKSIEFEISTNFEKQYYYSYFVPVRFGENKKAWMVEVTVPMHKILEASKKSIRESVLFTFVGIILMILVILFVTRKIIGPIKNVTGILDLLSKGDTKNFESINIKTGDELQKMNDSLNKVVLGLKKTEEFAIEIGKGNLEKQYTLLGNEDQLGTALLNMRDSLNKSKKEDENRKQIESRRNWATQGIAKFAEVLRQDNNDMKKLGFNVLSNLISYLDVNQGAIFVLNEDNDNNDTFYELITAIAFNREKFMNKEIQIGEGLVGRCAYEKKSIFIKEVPESYVKITSGLGTSNPRCVLLVPCMLNDEVYAIIEIASFKELTKHEVEFVEKLGESIGATISSVRINEKTTKLLRASQEQSEELAAQEEEMRQNLEEMQATQEDLKRQMQDNTQMRDDLHKQTSLLNALLNNIPDYIYFKDKESKFLRISKSMLHLFNEESADNVIGKSDFDFKGRDEAQKYFNDEQDIMTNLSGITDQIQKEEKNDGTVQWNSVTKMPLVDDDNNCIGTFGISKDVTKIKELEIETSKKQIELEETINSISNSTYMIQYDIDGVITDVNEAVLELFNISRDKIIGTLHKDGFDLKGVNNDQYLEYWSEIVNGEVKKENSKITINNIDVWLSETYSPIRNTEGEVYKIMKIAFDITEYKK